MKYEILGNIVEVSKGKKHNLSETPNLKSKRIIGINDLRNDTTLIYTDDKYGIEADEKDVLIAWDGANAGTIGHGKKGYIGSTISRLRIRNPEEYYVTFLGKLLQSKFEFLRSTSTGATIPHISRAALDSIKVPQFKISDQIRIATVLTRAEKLIAKRKESIKALDEFLKSTFLEMFGDPVRNEKGWNKKKLETFDLNLCAGTSYRGEEKGFLDEDELGVIKISAVTWGTFNPKEFKAVKKNAINKKIINPLKGDLLFSRANTRELVGATCIVDKDYLDLFLPDKIWKVSFNSHYLNKNYFHHLLQVRKFKDTLTKDATGSHGSMLNISMEKLRILSLPVPPIEVQNQFAAIVEKVESIKSKYTQSLTELENLYASLSQRAFKGKLDFIINYDIKYRMGKELDNGEEQNND